MTKLFTIAIQEVDAQGKEVEGHCAHSLLSAREINGNEIIDWLVKVASTGELSPKALEA